MDFTRIFTGDIFKTFGKGFTGYFANLDAVGMTGNNLGGIAAGFNAISESLEKSTKVLGTLGVGLADFMIVKDSVYDLVRGTDSLGKSRAEIAVATGVAGTALSALLGFPAGLLASLAVGAAAGLAGIVNGILDNDLEKFNQGVIDALTVPDGANLYDYMNNLTEDVRAVGDGFNNLAKQALNITDMKEKIGTEVDEIDESIQKIDLSLKAQIEVLPEDIQNVVNQFKGLNDDLRNVLGESYDIIATALTGWGDAFDENFEITRPEIFAAVSNVNKDMQNELEELDSQMAELQASFDAGDITSTQFYNSFIPLLERQNEIRKSLGLTEETIRNLNKLLTVWI